MKKVLFLMLLSFNCFGVEQSFTYKSYEDALKAPNYLKFDMESTKAGLLTTSFEGFVKTFKVKHEKLNDLIKGLEVEFMINALDTDIEGRNEKMHDKCFGKDQFHKIVVKLNDFKSNSSGDVSAKIKIRGEWKAIVVHVNAKMKGGHLLLEFKSEVGLKSLGIPDPSIFIASVRDRVDLSGKVALKN